AARRSRGNGNDSAPTAVSKAVPGGDRETASRCATVSAWCVNKPPRMTKVPSNRRVMEVTAGLSRRRYEYHRYRGGNGAYQATIEALSTRRAVGQPRPRRRSVRRQRQEQFIGHGGHNSGNHGSGSGDHG